jgi:hypothetical protein
MEPRHPGDSVFKSVGGSNLTWTINRIPDTQKSKLGTRAAMRKNATNIETSQIETETEMEIEAGSDGFGC